MTPTWNFKKLWPDVLAAGLIVALGAMVGISRITSLFDSFDYSGFLDVFYRVSQGQKLYADFFYNAGPVHPYIGAFFYWLMGPGGNAVKVNMCMLSLFMGVYSYVLARSTFSLPASMPLAALATLYFVAPLAFPSYDHHAWVFLLLAVAFSRVQLSKNLVLNASLQGAACGFLIALSVLTKANIGAIGGVIVAGILVMQGQRNRALMWLGLSFVLTINLVFFLLDTPFEFLQTNVVEYAPGARLTNWRWLLIVLHDIPYVALAFGGSALALVGGSDYFKRERLNFGVFFGLLIASVFSVWTASMDPDLNVFLVGLELLILFKLARRLPQGAPQSAAQRIYQSSTILLIFCCVLLAFTGAERIWRMGFFANRLPSLASTNYKIKAAPFKGWRCRSTDCEGMDDLIEYMRTQVPIQDSIFVFPDMQVIYQLTGHTSYLYAPFQFLLNKLPVPGKPTTVFLNHFDAAPPKWVVLHLITFLPSFALDTDHQLKSLYLDQYLGKNYTKVWQGKQYTLLKHN